MINNLYKYYQLLRMLRRIRKEKREIKKGTLLLIRLDAIGDYVLFRNFLYELKNDDKYKNYKMTICGNIVWKELAETLDKEIAEDFIWINRMKFLNDPDYKYEILKDVYLRGFETAIDTIHSREILFGDSVIAASGARERIGTIVTEKYHKLKKGIFSDRFYTRLIPAEHKVMFEFERTKLFFSRLLGHPVNVKRPEIDLSIIKSSPSINGKYIILFPGASRQNRMWSASNFKEVAQYLISSTEYIAAAAGSDNERELGERVRPDNSEGRFFNLCGGTLSEMAALIGRADLLISNNTSAIHFAAAADTPFICIDNGFYYGRFIPYPEEVFNKGYYAYPEGFTQGIHGNIDLVSPEEVISLINTILK
jgi:ADP-heptose:LPS heptosyltransferase